MNDLLQFYEDLISESNTGLCKNSKDKTALNINRSLAEDPSKFSKPSDQFMLHMGMVKVWAKTSQPKSRLSNIWPQGGGLS